MTDLQACHALLTRLGGGETVTTKEVRQAIGAAHRTAFDMELKHATALRQEAKAATSDLRDYINTLRTADLLNGRADNANDTAQARSLRQNAENRYESALERLQELLQSDRSLERHLDRVMDWGDEGGIVAPDAEAVPRIKYHARAYGEHEHREIPSLLHVMRSALQSAIADPAVTSSPPLQPSQQQRDDQSALIKAKLKALRSA